MMRKKGLLELFICACDCPSGDVVNFFSVFYSFRKKG